MHGLEQRIQRLEQRGRDDVGTAQPPAREALTTPERTAHVAQILAEVGALRITEQGHLLRRGSDGDWAPYERMAR